MKHTILIIEDELIIARDIRNILMEEGYHVITDIESVEDAIIAIELHKPNLIILDINLKKDKDGIDLGNHLLSKDTIPYIYLTSMSDKTTIERAVETRPYGYIIKPFKPSDIKTNVAIALHNFKHRNLDIIRQDKEINTEIPFILKQTIKYIEDNISEKIKVTDLAKQTRWESQHFNRLFNKYIGITPYKYIVDRKIDKAKTLLIETNIPVVQVSFELGFKSHSNFCSVFKKNTGKTPEAYRKWHEINEKYIK